jgi:hypothetical protein
MSSLFLFLNKGESKMLQKLWQDDCGALIATEWVFAATLLVLGVVTGLVATRNAVNSQINDFAEGIMGLNPSYHLNGQHSPESSTAGSGHVDNRIDIRFNGSIHGPNQQQPKSEKEWRELDLVQNDRLPCD